MLTEKYIARQPVLNNKGNTVAYELLFRDSAENIFPNHVSPEEATNKLFHNSVLEIGLGALSSGKKILMNIDEVTLHNDLIFSLPSNIVNFEILETITPSEENINRIKDLKKRGFKIILDDFVLSKKTKDFLPLSNLIKIDIQGSSWSKIKKEVFIYKKLGKKILAEKVESDDEFKKCKELGFDFYQGYFFCHPKILSRKCIQSKSHAVLSAYSAMINEDSYLEIANFMSIDLGLSEKFLKYAFNIFINKTKKINEIERIGSVYQAICLIGYDDTLLFLRIAMLDLAKDNNIEEVIKMSFIRGKFLQGLYSKNGAEHKNRAHLVGFFSLLDVLLDTPMSKIIKTLNLHKDIEDAILYQEGKFGDGLKLIQSIERNNLTDNRKLSKLFNMHVSTTNTLFQKSIEWEHSLSR